jgi:hypothetical protein
MLAVERLSAILIILPFLAALISYLIRVSGICVDICPATSLHQQSEYRLPLPGRETITLKGEPKQKIEKTTKIYKERNDDSKDQKNTLCD